MSVVKFEGLSHQGNKRPSCGKLLISSMNTNTDVKPYIPYADAIPSATSKFASHAPDTACGQDFINSDANTRAHQ